MNDERLTRELGAHRLLVGYLDLKAQIFDHTPDFWSRLAWCREVAVYEDRVGWIEGKGLKTSQIMFPASGNTDFGTRVKKAEEAEDFQTALRSKIVAML